MCADGGFEVHSQIVRDDPIEEYFSSSLHFFTLTNVFAYFSRKYGSALSSLNRLIVACLLSASDSFLRLLTAGDLTEIGERGVNLSGTFLILKKIQIFNSHKQTFLGRESKTFFACLKQYDNICLNIYF